MIMVCSSSRCRPHEAGHRRRLREEFRFVHGNFLVLVASYMLAGFASGLHYPFESPYFRGLGATVVEIGLISSVGAAVAAFIRVPGAYVADRYGRRRVIVAFTYVIAAAYLVHALAPDWRYILLGSVILNLGRVYHPALEAIEADSLPEERRGMGYSLINMAPGLFSALSPPIAGYVVSRCGTVPGMRALYMLTALFIAGIAVLRTLYLEETVETVTGELSGLMDHVRDSYRSFREAISEMDRRLWAFTLVELLFSLGTPIYGVFLSLFALGVVGVSEFEWGVVNTLYLPVTLLLSLPVGKLVDRLERRRSALLGYLFSAPVGLLLVYARGFTQLSAVYVLRAVGQTVVFPAIHALRADLVPVERRGRVMGLIGVMKNLAVVPSALFFAWLYEHVSPGYPFLLGSALEACIMVIIWVSFRSSNKME